MANPREAGVWRRSEERRGYSPGAPNAEEAEEPEAMFFFSIIAHQNNCIEKRIASGEDPVYPPRIVEFV
jgi:hypothetical protein